MAASILINNHFVTFARAVYRRGESHGSDTQKHIYSTHTPTAHLFFPIRLLAMRPMSPNPKHVVMSDVNVMFDVPFPIPITEVAHAMPVVRRFYAKIIILNDSYMDLDHPANMSACTR